MCCYKGRLLTALITIGLAVVLGASPIDSAQAVSRTRTVVFDFTSGELDGLADMTGQLTVYQRRASGGELVLLPRGDDWAVGFPARCDQWEVRCPRAILESDEASWLNPGRSDMSWGAQLRMTDDQVSEDSNVLQKGFSKHGSQFKLQVDGLGGRPSCVLAGPVHGRNRVYLALSPFGIADGHWHDVSCERAADTLTLHIDAEPVAERFVPVDLLVANDDPLRIGGKGVGPFNDQFHGAIDDVYVTIG